MKEYFLYNRSATTQLSTEGLTATKPQIHGSTVVWQQSDTHAPEIWEAERTGTAVPEANTLVLSFVFFVLTAFYKGRQQ